MSIKMNYNIIFIADTPFKWLPSPLTWLAKAFDTSETDGRSQQPVAPASLALRLDPLSPMDLCLPPSALLSYFSDRQALLGLPSLHPFPGVGVGREDLTSSLLPGCQKYRIISFLEISTWIWIGCPNLSDHDPQALKWGHWAMSRDILSWHDWGTLLASNG